MKQIQLCKQARIPNKRLMSTDQGRSHKPKLRELIVLVPRDSMSKNDQTCFADEHMQMIILREPNTANDCRPFGQQIPCKGQMPMSDNLLTKIHYLKTMSREGQRPNLPHFTNYPSLKVVVCPSAPRPKTVI